MRRFMLPTLRLVLKALLVLMGMCAPAFAADLGVTGALFPIKEPDLLQEIHEKLAYLQQTGQLKHMEEKIQAESKAQILRPQPIASLGTTTENKEWFFNPTIILSQDIKNAQGRILVKKGSAVNPLTQVHLHESLMFFNADDPEQVKWAEQKLQAQEKTIDSAHNITLKPILVQGDWSVLMKKWHQPVYFDQGGTLSTHFHLTHVPVIVFQKGTVFQMDEEVPPR